MRSRICIGITLVLATWGGSVLTAADLSLTLGELGTGAGTITVAPSAVVPYQVTAELSDSLNQGLALVLFDLSFDGGPLTPLQAPADPPMSNFVSSNGFSHNPQGYGGTVQGGNLVQVGGAQNFAAHGQWACYDDTDCPGTSTCGGGLCSLVPGLPVATLITGVAQPGSPVVVATGELVAPDSEGTCTLHASDVRALVVQQDTTGTPFWATEPVGQAVTGDLAITVAQAQPPPSPIPTLSTWGLVLLVLLLLAAGYATDRHDHRIGAVGHLPCDREGDPV